MLKSVSCTDLACVWKMIKEEWTMYGMDSAMKDVSSISSEELDN